MTILDAGREGLCYSAPDSRGKRPWRMMREGRGW
jgi:hypothetical protein